MAQYLISNPNIHEFILLGQINWSVHPNVFFFFCIMRWSIKTKELNIFFTCCDRLFPLGGDIDQGFPPPARATTCSIFSSVERFKLHSSFCLGCRETTTHTYTHSHIYIKYTRRCEFCPIQSRQQISHLLLISVKVAFPLKIKCVS